MTFLFTGGGRAAFLFTGGGRAAFLLADVRTGAEAADGAHLAVHLVGAVQAVVLPVTD